MEYLLIFISAIFVNNIVLSQFLGICPFLGVSKKVDTALGMSGAVAFVMTLATVVTSSRPTAPCSVWPSLSFRKTSTCCSRLFTLSPQLSVLPWLWWSSPDFESSCRLLKCLKE